MIRLTIPFPRQEIIDFANALEEIAKYNECRGKDDTWKTCDTDYLHAKLFEEVIECGMARTVEELEHEAADVGLTAMFLWWRAMEARKAGGKME